MKIYFVPAWEYLYRQYEKAHERLGREKGKKNNNNTIAFQPSTPRIKEVQCFLNIFVLHESGHTHMQ
jgi:hypothetical protein